MKKIFLLFFALLSLRLLAQNAADTRVFELRTYYAEPGKLDALIGRFRKHTVRLFEKHGMENIGYWVPLHNDNNQLLYVLAYPSLEAREAAWKAFGADPKWIKAKNKSERKGKLVSRVESVFLRAADFSPGIVATTPETDQVYELRTYTMLPGQLEPLLARFRQHTTVLFAKHGMTNVAYWTSIEKDAQQARLVYFLAHPSEAAGQKAFETFGKDPAWIQVKTDSERNGKLVEKIESIYLQALKM
ncbi:MAG: NIPSNAP family protein [Saprospiraceae bacterium]|nr:NIPSNAP family protein [Saprospiraceae bacterium]